MDNSYPHTKIKPGNMFREIPNFEVQIWAEANGYFNNIEQVTQTYFAYRDENEIVHKKYWCTKLTPKDVRQINAIHKRNWDKAVQRAKDGDELSQWLVNRR